MTSIIGRGVLSDQVYEAILAQLMDGQLKSGDQISIDGTSRQLGVSPTPVREALARLEATGLVRRAALRGYRVPPLMSQEEIGELMDARVLLETHTTAEAARHLDEDFLASLERAIEEQAVAPTGPTFADWRPYWEADERFHRLIAGRSGNRFVRGAYDSLGGHVHRFRLFGGIGVSDARLAVKEHRAILAALRKGEPDAAADAMRDHIEAVRARTISETADQ